MWMMTMDSIPPPRVCSERRIIRPQFRSLSPYFDKKLFSYDERTITAIDRLQPPKVDFGIKFINVRRGTRRRVSFKLMVSNSMANNARSKRRVQYVFHPVYPFAMSISIAYMQPTLVNFHVRSAHGDEMSTSGSPPVHSERARVYL